MAEKKVTKRRKGALYPWAWCATPHTSSKCLRVHAPYFYRKPIETITDAIRRLELKEVTDAKE